jgi:hypothetical protein
MGAMLDARRRLVGRFGRPMRLRRTIPNAPAQFVPLLGVTSRYQPGDIEGAIQQGDERVEITADEVGAAGWTEITINDWLLKDGKQQTLKGANPVYEGPLLIGYSLWVKG